MSSRNSTGETYGKGRTRNFATIVYPESAPENWKSILEEEMVPAFISPLHDMDKNPTDPATGIAEPKKPHFHVILAFETVKTIEQAEEIIKKIGGVGCKALNSLRGYARYLCHLDNPEKAQYDIDNVICLCGADYASTINLPTDKYSAIKEMIEFCRTEKIYLYSDLLDYCAINRSDWFRVLCDNGTMVIMTYLKSLQYKANLEAEEEHRKRLNIEASAIMAKSRPPLE